MKRLQILGADCPNCRKLFENAEDAARELQIQFVMEKITDIDRIGDFGVTMTPALAINSEVKSQGKILNVEEIKTLLL
ncbi:thioredoxin family protein [bacterium]|nr:thioredoxin family protein [bacterium]